MDSKFGAHTGRPWDLLGAVGDVGIPSSLGSPLSAQHEEGYKEYLDPESIPSSPVTCILGSWFVNSRSNIGTKK